MPAESPPAASPADCRNEGRLRRVDWRAHPNRGRRPMRAPPAGSRPSRAPWTSRRSRELLQQATRREIRLARRNHVIGLVAVTALHQLRMFAKGYAPVLELAPVAVDRAQLHHHLVRFEIEYD